MRARHERHILLRDLLDLEKHAGVCEPQAVLEKGDLGDFEISQCSFVLDQEVAERKSVGCSWRQSIPVRHTSTTSS